jgi:hypothetical protein
MSFLSAAAAARSARGSLFGAAKEAATGKKVVARPVARHRRVRVIGHLLIGKEP